MYLMLFDVLDNTKITTNKFLDVVVEQPSLPGGGINKALYLTLLD